MEETQQNQMSLLVAHEGRDCLFQMTVNCWQSMHVLDVFRWSLIKREGKNIHVNQRMTKRKITFLIRLETYQFI